MRSRGKEDGMQNGYGEEMNRKGKKWGKGLRRSKMRRGEEEEVVIPSTCILVSWMDLMFIENIFIDISNLS